MKKLNHLKTNKLINRLYEEGHTIKMFTARGTTTNIDWYDFTKTVR